MSAETHEVVTEEWVTFPGGELEGKRPKALCAACRDALKMAGSTAGRSSGKAASAAARSRLLCFDCYRADLARTRALQEAGELDTASVARFQTQLPFEPVNQPRLDSLKAARAAARDADGQGIGQYANKRRRAQIQARHALQTIAAGLSTRGLTPAAKALAMTEAIHAAELQLPEAWLPYVVSR
jgi:hypothetical protein